MSTANSYLDAPARPAPERPPFVGLGEHLFDVEEIVKADSPTKGPTVWVRLIVVESTLHPVGSKVTQRFELAKQEKYPTSRTQSELAKDFTAALIGTTDLTAAGEVLKGLLNDDPRIQKACGIRIRARGYAKPGKTWVHVTWNHFDQNETDVAARRAAIVARNAAGATPAVQATAPVAAPPAAPTAAPSLLGSLGK